MHIYLVLSIGLLHNMVSKNGQKTEPSGDPNQSLIRPSEHTSAKNCKIIGIVSSCTIGFLSTIKVKISCSITGTGSINKLIRNFKESINILL